MGLRPFMFGGCLPFQPRLLLLGITGLVFLLVIPAINFTSSHPHSGCFASDSPLALPAGAWSLSTGSAPSASP